MHVSIIGVLQAATVLIVAVSVLTAIPIDFFGLQLFTHFRLQYLVVGLLLLAAFITLKQPPYAAALLVATIINASFVVPWYVGATAASGDTDLKIVQANILSSNTAYEKLFAFVKAEQPDVIVLQEVTPQWLLALDALRADYRWSYAEAREGNFGIALFSRLPLKSVSHVDSAPLGNPTIIATIDVGNDALNLVASHPMIPVSMGLYAARNTQLDGLVDLLDKSAGSTILIGDLNASMWDTRYRALEEQAGLKNARLGFGVLPTWPTFLPFAMIPIDHVLVSSEIGVRNVRTGPRIGSDHLPLVVTITL